jgi:hypothetical protein
LGHAFIYLFIYLFCDKIFIYSGHSYLCKVLFLQRFEPQNAFIPGFPLLVTAPSLTNVTDEQYFLQQDSVQEPSGNPTNPGGETTHARKEITPGTCRKHWSQTCVLHHFLHPLKSVVFREYSLFRQEAHIVFFIKS